MSRGREILRRRYLNLGIGELVAAATFAVVAAVSVAPRLGERAAAALWAALVPLLVILVQAGVYWLSARRWVARAPRRCNRAALLRAFRVADPALLIVRPAYPARTWFSAVGQWRTPRLVKDLRSARR